MSLDKQFNFNDLENKIYLDWESSGCFKPKKK